MRKEREKERRIPPPDSTTYRTQLHPRWTTFYHSSLMHRWPVKTTRDHFHSIQNGPFPQRLREKPKLIFLRPKWRSIRPPTFLFLLCLPISDSFTKRIYEFEQKAPTTHQEEKSMFLDFSPISSSSRLRNFHKQKTVTWRWRRLARLRWPFSVATQLHFKVTDMFRKNYSKFELWSSVEFASFFIFSGKLIAFSRVFNTCMKKPSIKD